MAEEERDAILSRKEMVSGENMQLIMESEHIRFAINNFGIIRY
jgi:hypothetical protein